MVARAVALIEGGRWRGAILSTAAYAVALAGSCWFAWLGYVALGSWSVREGARLGLLPLGGFPALLWLAPTVYLAAWQFLVVRRLRLVALGITVTSLLTIATFHVAFFGGLLGVAVLGGFADLAIRVLPGAAAEGVRAVTVSVAPLAIGALGVWLIAAMLQRVGSPGPGEAATPISRRMHMLTLMPALFGLAVTTGGLLVVGPVHPFGLSASGWSAWLALLFLPHAAAAWFLIGRAQPPGPLAGRGVILLALAWGVPAVILSRSEPDRRPLPWPWRVAGIQEEERAQLDLFRQAGGLARGYVAGERFNVAIGDRRLDGTVPEGWLLLNPRRPRPDRVSPVLQLARDPRAASDALLIRRITVGTGPVAVQVWPPGAAPEGRNWIEAGCVGGDPWAGGLTTCRALTGVPEQLTRRIPEEQITTRAVLGMMDRRSYFLFGRALNGTCTVGGSCFVRFALDDGLHAFIAVPEAAMERWQDVRGQIDAVVQSAIGRPIIDGEVVQQPRGEVLTLPPP